MSTFHERLKEFRAHTRLSQQAFADKAGVEQVSISQMERGRSKASFEAAAKILASFPELSPDWLLNGMGEMLRDNRQLTPLPKDPTPSVVVAAQQQEDPFNLTRRYIEHLERENAWLRENLGKPLGNPDAARSFMHVSARNVA